MKPRLTSVTLLLLVLIMPVLACAQKVAVGEVMMIGTSPWKKVPEGLKPSFRKTEEGKATVHLLQADRGDHNGDFLLVCSIPRANDRGALPKGSPFTDSVISFSAGGEGSASNYISDPGAYTEYRLIGAEKFTSLPVVDLIGIHYIKVKEDRAADFEKFVVEKLHPAVGHILPDMQLLYYKAVAGDNKGSYITIFTITSHAAREVYWPTGNPETQILKDAFLPQRELGRELQPYLVENSYLEEAGGAAAYFESKEWTDYLVINE